MRRPEHTFPNISPAQYWGHIILYRTVVVLSKTDKLRVKEIKNIKSISLYFKRRITFEQLRTENISFLRELLHNLDWNGSTTSL